MKIKSSFLFYFFLLLVLVGLEKKYGDKKSEWSFLAKKSEKWASSKLGAMFDAWKSAAQAAF